MTFNKTKIVATIGPASADYETLKKMVLAGMNVCRINCSHGRHEDLKLIIENIRKINEELQSNVPILADLQGPKLRVGEMENGGTELQEGKKILITTQKCIGTADKIYINYDNFPLDVKPDEIVLLDDGKLQLQIKKTNKIDEVEAIVINGGYLSSRKGVNLPKTKVSLPSLTEKDLKDLDFVLEHEVEWIGLSFVRSASDIIELRHLISKKRKQSRIIAKIEKPEAIEDLDNIVKECDAIMVARGDLGVEMPMEQVPVIQKMIVKTCLKEGKPCIIATQMMESMITNVTPTRAEVNDAANSILDGADAVMLSGETSTGKHPVKVIENIKKIISFVESNEKLYRFTVDFDEAPQADKSRFISNYICRDACHLADQSGAKAIITMTGSGFSAMKVAGYRPNCNIYAFTSNKILMNTLSLVWGVRTIYYDKFVSTDHTIADIRYILRKMGYAKEGDLIINIASIPMEERGMSNMLKMSVV
jgi:pyruvate kinase